MDYIPGNIHQKMQSEKMYKILTDWNIVICKKRYNDVDLMNDDEFYSLSTEVGDIILVRLFKPNGIDSTKYYYIDKVIKQSGDILEIKSESLMSMEFVEHNQKNQVLFEEASLLDIRDIKINQIIK